jgi:putative FmdB family regulatory protein
LEGIVPIYEYRCSACGFQKEYLRKVSDPLLSVCPECSKETFGKMLTAAGFQLKGGGWYAESKTETMSKSEGKSEGKSDSKTEAQPAAATAPVSPASTARAE